MKTIFLILSLLFALNGFASEVDECTPEQVRGYQAGREIRPLTNGTLVIITAGEASYMYSTIVVDEVDSRTLGTVGPEVENHFTKLWKDTACFKQVIKKKNCATYHCNVRVPKAD